DRVDELQQERDRGERASRCAPAGRGVRGLGPFPVQPGRAPDGDVRRDVMSASERTARPMTAAGGFGDAAVVVAGLGLLMWRVVAPASVLTPVMMALLYAAVLAMSMTGPSGATAPSIAPSAAAVLGVGAVLATRLVAGPAFGPTS